ncbi:FkbM family methyltransferase [Bordetella genomosp. 9]|nr:FkbM family methyltransferase [Bordetella genomosp. 9]
MTRALKHLIGPQAHLVSLFRTIRAVPYGLRLPIFGPVSTLNEILNIHDNFGKGELRHVEIERYLRQTAAPVIVDCGVNVGITVRWWRHLNPQARVIGIDMMEEAHAFTKARLPGMADWYEPVTCALAAQPGLSMEISFDDPLLGENSVTSGPKAHKRRVVTATLDGALLHQGVRQIDLLKIDIEGYGAEALKGAGNVLPMVRYVFFETHSRSETSEAAALLHNAGFNLISLRNRSFVYENVAACRPSRRS